MKDTHNGRSSSIPLDDSVVGSTLFLPEAVVVEVERLLPSYRGRDEHEGIVYLGGAEGSSGSMALTALSPAASTTWGSFRTDVDANTAVVSALSKLGMTLVGQVHSHPGEWVDHSDGDDSGALVRFGGYWSIVVPVFARDGLRPIQRCGFHLYQEGCFKRLTARAVGARVRVVPASVDLRRP